jgi:hypothetical protein
VDNEGFGAFMGYRGLLLNAPYKIDSMVWIVIGFGSIKYYSWFNLFLVCLGYRNQRE